MRRVRAEDGQDAVEYVLLALFIGLAVTVGMMMMATVANASYSDAAGCIQTAAGAPAQGGGTRSPGLGGGTGAPGQGKGQGQNNPNGGGGAGGAGSGSTAVCP